MKYRKKSEIFDVFHLDGTKRPDDIQRWLDSVLGPSDPARPRSIHISPAYVTIHNLEGGAGLDVGWGNYILISQHGRAWTCSWETFEAAYEKIPDPVTTVHPEGKEDKPMGAWIPTPNCHGLYLEGKPVEYWTGLEGTVERLHKNIDELYRENRGLREKLVSESAYDGWKKRAMAAEDKLNTANQKLHNAEKELEKLRGSYPTPWAYEQACEALHKHEEGEKKAKAEVERLQKEVAGYESILAKPISHWLGLEAKLKSTEEYLVVVKKALVGAENRCVAISGKHKRCQDQLVELIRIHWNTVKAGFEHLEVRATPGDFRGVLVNKAKTYTEEEIKAALDFLEALDKE